MTCVHIAELYPEVGLLVQDAPHPPHLHSTVQYSTVQYNNSTVSSMVLYLVLLLLGGLLLWLGSRVDGLV